jgi:hypothetical protein
MAMLILVIAVIWSDHEHQAAILILIVDVMVVPAVILYFHKKRQANNPFKGLKAW